MNSVDEQANRLTETLGNAFLSHRITLDDCRRIVAEVLKTTRQEALREAARVCSDWHKIDRSHINNVAEMAEVLATKLDRLASEGG